MAEKYLAGQLFIGDQLVRITNVDIYSTQQIPFIFTTTSKKESSVPQHFLFLITRIILVVSAMFKVIILAPAKKANHRKVPFILFRSIRKKYTLQNLAEIFDKFNRCGLYFLFQVNITIQRVPHGTIYTLKKTKQKFDAGFILDKHKIKVILLLDKGRNYFCYI